MQTYITLVGAEQVQTAANTISSAATEMSKAVGNLEHVLFLQRQFMDDWLMRLEQALNTAPQRQP